MMSRWRYVWRLLPLFAAFAFILTGCGKENLSALMPKGPVAKDQFWLVTLSFAIMLFVLVVVFLIYIYVLIRFRKRKDQTEYPKQVEGSHTLEVVWTVIPFVLLIILAVPTIALTFKLDKDYSNDPNALQIKVTGHQFWWEFEYLNEKITTAQDLYIPTGRTVSFHLETADVIHSFWVPALGGKKDTNPGMTNMLYLKADEPGVYYGKCAELCGASHALMEFKVIAVTPSEFDAWVAGMKAPASANAALTGAAAEGEAIFKKSCIGCHAVPDRQTKAVTGGKLGPSLVGFADRKTVAGILLNEKPEDFKKNLKEWLSDPQEVKPGNRMPNPKKVPGSRMEQDLGLDDRQIDALVEYLSTLKMK